MTTPRKKPYASPTIRSESVIETSTLACGKCLNGGPTGASTPSCKQARRVS